MSNQKDVGPKILCNVFYNGEMGTIVPNCGLDLMKGIDKCQLTFFATVKEEILKDISFSLNKNNEFNRLPHARDKHKYHHRG